MINSHFSFARSLLLSLSLILCLGVGAQTPEPMPQPDALVGATTVSGGRHHTCAVVAGGAVKCWGFNSYGQLGNDSTVNAA